MCIAYCGDMAKRGSAEVHSITSAQRGLSEQQPDRTKRYLVSMGIRTVCVLGAIFVPGWPRWVLVAGAVLLPYLAVILANGGREDNPRSGVVTPRAALPSGSDLPPAEPS